MKIYNIETQGNILLHNLGVNSSTPYFKHAIAEMKTLAMLHPQMPVGKIAMRTKDGIAIANGTDTYLLVNETVIEKRNGDGILFQYQGEPWTYIPDALDPSMWSDLELGDQGKTIDSDIAALMADEMTPLLSISGEHQTGKSTVARCILTAIHGRITEVTPIPTTDKGLRTVLAGDKAIAFDNVEKAEPFFHDTICMAVTRAKIKDRKLYCDKETVSMELNNMVIVTSIDDTSMLRDDVISRSVYIRTERKQIKRHESELYALILNRRNQYLSYLVGVIKSAYSKPLVKHHRLVGWATLAKEIGLEKEYFDALANTATEKLSESVPLVDMLKEYLGAGGPQYDKGKDLYDGMQIVLQKKLNSDALRHFPSSWRKMSPILQRHAELIEKKIGLTVDKGKEGNNISLKWGSPSSK